MLATLRTWSVTTVTAVSVLSPFAAAQASLPVPDGFSATMIHREGNGPFALAGFAKDPFTEHVYLAVQNELWKVDAKGNRTRIHQLPKTNGFGMVELPAGSSTIYFTDFKTHELFRYHVLTNKLSKLAGIPNTYDVAIGSKGEVIVVANPNFPKKGAKSGVWVTDMTGGGKHHELVRLDGPSGPIAFDHAGNLLYAVQSSTFPTPKGSIKVVRFSARQVQAAMNSTTPLQMSQGTDVLKNLDGALDMVFDDRGRLYLSDPQNGGLVRTRPRSMILDGTWLPRITSPSKIASLWLQFVERSSATFDAFQPADGGDLYLGTTDWTTDARVWRLDPSRPALASTPSLRIPKGPIQLDLSGAPRRANVLLFLSTANPLAAEVTAFHHQGVPGWLGLDLAKPFLVLAAQTDSLGSYQLKSSNPGGSTYTVHLQALIAQPQSAPKRQVATSTVLRLNVQK